MKEGSEEASEGLYKFYKRKITFHTSFKDKRLGLLSAVGKEMKTFGEKFQSQLPSSFPPL